MKELVVDGERGIVTAAETLDYCKAKGIKVHQRAPQQHARIVERRGALLRDAIHRLDSQLEEEGLTVPFEQRLNECVFAGNALISVNNCTPYNALYGRNPLTLPGLELLNSEGEVVAP